MKILFYFDGCDILIAREDQKERIKEIVGFDVEPREVFDFDEKPLVVITLNVLEDEE